jgi:AcrR family transcriptional regulator
VSPAPKARGPRRTPRESAEFRDRIIAVARDLFAEEGFEAVSIRKIAQRAGCPPMTFYVVFKSKRALLRHIWEDVFADLLNVCSAAVAAAAPGPEARLAALMRTLARYWVEHPDNYRVVFMHQDKVAADDEAFYVDSSGIHGRLQLVNAIIEEGVAAGVFRPVDSELTAQAFLAATIGLAHALITIPEYPWRREALSDHTIALLIAGLRAAPGPAAA